MTAWVLLVTVLWLAYANGANDNFKGVATLYGSGTTGFRAALSWSTLATLAGSCAAVLLARRLAATFSGEGILSGELMGTWPIRISVAGAAAVTILLATVLGMPTSTTHALLGALLGAAFAADPERMRWGVLQGRFLQPLLLSPLAAIAGAGLCYPLLRAARAGLGITRETCVCVGDLSPQPANPAAALAPFARLPAPARAVPALTVGPEAVCRERYLGRVLGLSAQAMVDRVHFLSAGVVCFARAVNDTPKIAALMIAAGRWLSWLHLGLIALAMAVGGVLGSRKVARTMGKRITALNSGQGLTANLVTAAFVLGASRLGLPVSTTHVACGSIFGIGLVRRSADGKVIAQILAAWVTTLPVAALLGGGLFSLLRPLA
ncbi:MAG: inorganic phosphate transporter [Planctomycetes bacterium]|nr:inorganic phosphate transporter [Planctomycetota bacterium]